MSKKVKVINNVHSVVGFYLNPLPESFRVLPKQGAFLQLTEEELDYIHINQSIIQKGLIWIDDVELRVKYGIENDKGEKENSNVLQYAEILELVKGNHKRLEKVMGEITEDAILQQFVEASRELKLDSKAKIDIIEAKAKIKIYDEE